MVWVPQHNDFNQNYSNLNISGLVSRIQRIKQKSPAQDNTEEEGGGEEEGENALEATKQLGWNFDRSLVVFGSFLDAIYIIHTAIEIQSKMRWGCD